MKKGFTLVELLAVIAILGVIALIAIPAVDRAIDEGKEAALETQKAQMIKGAKDFYAENPKCLPGGDVSSCVSKYGENKFMCTGSMNMGNKIVCTTTITTVSLLQGEGFLQLNIKNPKNDDYVLPSAQIQVKSVGNGFQYTVLEETMIGSSSVTDGPTIVLKGGNIQYVELGSIFADNGYTATSSYGTTITNVDKIIKNEYGEVVGTEDKDIKTNSVGTYTIKYSATEYGDNNNIKTAEATKTVMVVDTTKPVITLNQELLTSSDYLEKTALEVINYNFLALVTATDNSGTSPTINFTSNVSQIAGTYTVTYTAEDTYGNRATKKLTVRVTDAISIEATNPNSYEDKKTVIIKFPTIEGKEYINQYSTDYGITWQTIDTSEISLEFTETTMIIARIVENDESVMSVSYTITKFNSD